MRHRTGGLGSIVAIAAVVVISWLSLRKMTDTQRALASDAGVIASTGTPSTPSMPPALIADARAAVLRLDVVLRVDGLDITADGAPACRANGKRLIGRQTDGAIGSFDEGALVACVTKLRAERPSARPIALVSRAGPAVPATYFDALRAALVRAGVAEVIGTP